MTRDNALPERISRAAENLTDDLVATVSELVRINTVNPYSGDDTASSELPGQLYLKDRLESAGFVTRMLEVPPDVYERAGMLGPAGRSWKDRPNLVGELTFPPGGAPESASDAGRTKTVVLNCHMDTVGAAGMTIEPFSGAVRDGRIWGRGSSDSKGNLAVGLFAVRALQAAGVPVRGQVIFESVVDEECNGGGAGTIACCLAGCRGDAAICLDGIGSQPCIGCNGVLTVELLVHGRAGHAASGAVNAIDKARVLADAMDCLKAEREALAPPMMVNLGVFQAGSIPAIVPSQARLAWNLSYSVAEADESRRQRGTWSAALLRERIQRLLEEACRADDWLGDHPPTVTWVKDCYPFSTSADEHIVRVVSDSVAELTGRPAQPHHMSAWGDACHLAILGRMPTVGFGSATPGMAHAAGECVEIDRLVLGVKIVALAVARFLQP